MEDLAWPKVKFMFFIALGLTHADGWKEPRSILARATVSALLGVLRRDCWDEGRTGVDLSGDLLTVS